MATQPFQYGLTEDPANNTYPLRPGNAAPALVVWLFLVTQPDFLSKPLPVDLIAQYTNLQPGTVQSILDSYLTADQPTKTSFTNVCDAFQDLCKRMNLTYLPGQCPHDHLPMLWLAYQGAQVDPAAKNLPPLPL